MWHKIIAWDLKPPTLVTLANDLSKSIDQFRVDGGGMTVSDVEELMTAFKEVCGVIRESRGEGWLKENVNAPEYS